jgi:hypothetical protein
MTVFCDLKIPSKLSLEKGIPGSFIATTTNKAFDLQALDFIDSLLPIGPTPKLEIA